ncbi:hypothetical protein BDQ17DRAFT_1335309 [Cyathus striatus]|nr:hypothetical protein BDQ17DRAFT_1335309 [Cyathus striatus]
MAIISSSDSEMDIDHADYGIGGMNNAVACTSADQEPMNPDVSEKGESEQQAAADLITPDEPQEFILTEYHPYSGKKSIQTPIEKYTGSNVLTAESMDELWGDLRPWHPFRTAQELEFSEKCTRQNFSNNTSQEWLDYIKSLEPKNSNLTFSNVSEMNHFIESASSQLVGFERIEFTIPYKKENYKYEVL